MAPRSQKRASRIFYCLFRRFHGLWYRIFCPMSEFFSSVPYDFFNRKINFTCQIVLCRVQYPLQVAFCRVPYSMQMVVAECSPSGWWCLCTLKNSLQAALSICVALWSSVQHSLQVVFCRVQYSLPWIFCRVQNPLYVCCALQSTVLPAGGDLQGK